MNQCTKAVVAAQYGNLEVIVAGFLLHIVPAALGPRILLQFYAILVLPKANKGCHGRGN